MEFLTNTSKFPKKVAVVLGFFDGIHAGHREIIKKIDKQNSVLITFSQSPAEYFNKNAEYIYTRKYNYELLKELGVNYIWERNFSDIVNISAFDYLKDIIFKFDPISISTGFNHNFGLNKEGDSDFLIKNLNNIEYFCTPAYKIDGVIVSSTKIKEFLKNGNIEKANKFLTKNFTIESKVIEGNKIGRTIGFPTANMNYPENIIKIPYGVYKIKTLNKLAVMNWGIKPTIGSKEVLEVHIPNYNENLYNKNLRIEILSKIRDEKKFANLDELKRQIKKDLEKCLEL